MQNRAERLLSRGYALAEVQAPVAAYRPVVVHGSQAYCSGAIAKDGARGLVYAGQVGSDLTVEEGARAAELCAANLLRSLHHSLGSLDLIAQVLKVQVFVNSAAGFGEAHLVANGASELFGFVLGEAGQHARSAVSVAGLPLNSAVEVDAIVQLVS